MAELGPGTLLDGPGPENGAERTQNQPRRPILKPFRDHLVFFWVVEIGRRLPVRGLAEGG